MVLFQHDAPHLYCGFVTHDRVDTTGKPSPGAAAIEYDEEGDLDWQLASLPTYMQHGNIVEFCRGWEEGVLRVDVEAAAGNGNVIWQVIR